MKTKMINCKACGNEISANAKICPNCGNKNKKPIYKSVWFYLLLLIIIVVVAVSGGDEEATGSNSDNFGINSETSSTVNVDSSVAETYKSIAEMQSDITISEDAINFMKEHENFFPGNDSISGTMSDYVNKEIGYSHLSKNISKYDDKLIAVNGYVIDIEESEDSSLTYIHIVDYDGNSYVLYYLGTLEEIFEEDEVEGFALPFSMITFENLDGAYTEAVAGAACYIKPLY